MKYSNHFKKVIKISGYVIAVLFIVGLFVSPLNEKNTNYATWKALLRRFSVLISFVSIFWLLYYTFLWKYKSRIFRNLFFDQPDLSGTWMGYLKSDYLENNKPIDPIKIAFFIRQTNFFDIRITSHSSTSAFFSFGEILEFDASNNMIRILYQYSQKKTSPNSRNDQQGAADLFLYEDYLAGHYWTIVKTSGFIRVHKVSNKKYGSFEEADRHFGDNKIINECYSIVQLSDTTFA